MGAALEMVADQGKRNDVAILCWELQTHVKLIFEDFVVETAIIWNKNPLRNNQSANEIFAVLTWNFD